MFFALATGDLAAEIDVASRQRPWLHFPPKVGHWPQVDPPRATARTNVVQGCCSILQHGTQPSRIES